MKEFVGFKGNYENVNRYKFYLAGLYFNSSRFQNELKEEIKKALEKKMRLSK